MAYTSGTAANYKDLLAVLATFAAANGWTILEQSTTRLYLRGEGSEGLDEIYAGVEAFENTSSGYYNWLLTGSWGYRSGRVLTAHPMNGGSRYAYLWNAPIPYWMVATPRRIMMVAKISTLYQIVHLGLGDPPATANQYPYPLIIGGCGSVAAQGYSITGTENSVFCANQGPNGLICRPGGDWDSIGPAACAAMNPSYENRANIITAPNGDYSLEQIYILDTTRTSIYAAIDGLFRVSGYNNTADNIVTVGSNNYLVFQDVYRTSIGDYFAMRLD